jgi:hypothetical protein
MIVKDFRLWYGPCRAGRGAALSTPSVAARGPGKPTPNKGGGGESTDGAAQWLVVPPNGGSGWVGDSVRLHWTRCDHGALASDPGRNESAGRLSSCTRSNYRADRYAAASVKRTAGSGGRGGRAQRSDEAHRLPAGKSGWRTEKIVRADIELNPIERGPAAPSGKQHWRHIANQQSHSLPQFCARLALSLCPIASLVGHFFRL